MLPAGSILSFSTSVVGLLLGGVALGGFFANVSSAASGRVSEAEMREAALRGGLVGIGGAAFLIVLSALIG